MRDCDKIPCDLLPPAAATVGDFDTSSWLGWLLLRQTMWVVVWSSSDPLLPLNSKAAGARVGVWLMAMY